MKLDKWTSEALKTGIYYICSFIQIEAYRPAVQTSNLSFQL